MVRVGFVRTGNEYHFNRNLKGVFYREFSNISKMAEWFAGCYPKVCVADYCLLTEREKRSFNCKVTALRRKKNA